MRRIKLQDYIHETHIMTSFPSEAVGEVIKKAIRGKLNAYNPEPAVMPFHTRLLGRDKIVLYSFIQSLNKTFGTSICEPLPEVVAQENFERADLQVKPPEMMSKRTRNKIDEIVRELEIGNISPDRDKHYADLRSTLFDDSETMPVKLTKIDVLLKRENALYLVNFQDVETEQRKFLEIKRMLLEWMGAYLWEDPTLEIYPIIAIPYNPYAPKPYKRWTMRGMIDIKNELKVAEEFWNFLGGVGAYEELLDCFERAGIELRDEIDEYFSKFSKAAT